MKKFSLPGLIILALFICCSASKQGLEITSCNTGQQEFGYSKANNIQQALGKLTQAGVPGVAMAVYSDEGWWVNATGYAKIEGRIPMQTCHLLYLQSISKTYMAVAILKLYEMGKIDLDAPIAGYLPGKYIRHITDADKIPVRMLLNHTSGLPEYNYQPAYVSYLLQHPEHKFLPEDYLKYIDGKPLDFEPGSKYSYRNINYVILALIADVITGDHARFISETIFQPLVLNNTYYRDDHGYLNYPTLVNAYWDRHSNGIIENASHLQRNNVASLIGDDGIVATPADAVKFLKGLMEGKLITPSTLELMKTWVSDRNGLPAYGLGLDHETFLGHEAFGHSGGGLGAGCQLHYFPEKGIYVFIGINLGTVTESIIHEKAAAIVDEIYAVLLE